MNRAESRATESSDGLVTKRVFLELGEIIVFGRSEGSWQMNQAESRATGL